MFEAEVSALKACESHLDKSAIHHILDAFYRHTGFGYVCGEDDLAGVSRRWVKDQGLLLSR